MFDPEIGGLFCDYGECPMVPSSDKRCTYICNKEKKQGKLSLVLGWYTNIDTSLLVRGERNE